MDCDINHDNIIYRIKGGTYMLRSELTQDIKEKILFEGPVSTGKTYLCMIVTKIYAINKNIKKIYYVDPEAGVDKSKEKIWGNLTDEELNKIELIQTTNILSFLKAMMGWTEEVKVGDQITQVEHYIDCDLKVIDGLSTEMEMYKTELVQKFLKQGYYEIQGTKFNIKTPMTFNLPYQFYGNLYDQIKRALVVMLDHKYDIIGSEHTLRTSTDSQKELQQSIYAKFDSVIELKKELSNGYPCWSAKTIKNRGRESPDKSNEMSSVEPIIKYFIKKFGMNMEETMERLIPTKEEKKDESTKSTESNEQ